MHLTIVSILLLKLLVVRRNAAWELLRIVEHSLTSVGNCAAALLPHAVHQISDQIIIALWDNKSHATRFSVYQVHRIMQRSEPTHRNGPDWLILRKNTCVRLRAHEIEPPSLQFASAFLNRFPPIGIATLCLRNICSMQHRLATPRKCGWFIGWQTHLRHYTIA